MKKIAIIAAAALALCTTGAMAAGDPAAGEKVFKKCAGCHAIGEGATNKVGPALNGILGEKAGVVEGYAFSQAMIDAGAGGLVWTPETLSEFLKKPRDFVKGTKMSFPGLPKDDDIANVVAYVQTFSPDFKAE